MLEKTKINEKRGRGWPIFEKDYLPTRGTTVNDFRYFKLYYIEGVIILGKVSNIFLNRYRFGGWGSLARWIELQCDQILAKFRHLGKNSLFIFLFLNFLSSIWLNFDPLLLSLCAIGQLFIAVSGQLLNKNSGHTG